MPENQVSSHSTSIYDRLTVATAIAGVFLSIVAVIVTFRVARQQEIIAEQQSETEHSLAFSDIYFSDRVVAARDTMAAVYDGAFESIVNSSDPNGTVGRLNLTAQQTASFDELIALYDQLGVCVNSDVCKKDIVDQLYGAEMTIQYQNWFGYILKRRSVRGDAHYGCALASFLGHQDDFKTAGDPYGCAINSALPAKAG